MRTLLLSIPALIVLTTAFAPMASAGHTPEFWASGDRHPTGVTDGAGAWINDAYYVSHGTVAGEVSAALHVFDPFTNTWTALTSADVPRTGALGAVIAGKLLVIGGENAEGDAVASVEMYDPNTDTWSSVADLSVPRTNAIAGVVGGKVHVAGGENADGALASMEVYNHITDAWSMGPALPEARTEAAGAANEDGFLFVLGGRGTVDGAPEGSNFMYDSSAEEWLRGRPLPVRSADAVGGDCAGHIYVAGGLGPGDVPLASTFRLNMGSLAWTEVESMILPRAGAANAFTSDDSLGVIAVVGASAEPDDTTYLFNCSSAAFPIPELGTILLTAMGVVGVGALALTGRKT